MACSNFCLKSFFRSATTFVAKRVKKLTIYFSTFSKCYPPPSIKAFSTFLLHNVCRPSNTTWAGFFSIILMSYSPMLVYFYSAAVISPITFSRKVARVNLISLSTFVSQTFILGSYVIFTPFLN